MIHILHISDLHFVNNAATYITEEILIAEAANRVKDIPQGQKLLIITGDLHNYLEADYQKAEVFIKRLVSEMDLDISKDVFLVPGNHDVGNDTTLEPLLRSSDSRWKSHQKSCLAMLKAGDKDYIEERLLSFRPYSSFVQRLGIYNSFLGEDFPAHCHLRNWRGKLNILNLNTALIANGKDKTDQLIDIDTVANSKTWTSYFDKKIPSIAIGHNNFYDLRKYIRNELSTIFFIRNVSAYLCGDRHQFEQDPEHQYIPLTSRHTQPIVIPNLVAAKGIADRNDEYSEVGFCWHQWDEKKNTVNVEFRKWTQNCLANTTTACEDGKYVMRCEMSSCSITSSESTVSECKGTHHPIVFISYSRKSEEYMERVFKLAAKLREDGVDVIIDKWNLRPGESLSEFLERSIQKSDKVLVLCEDSYAQKADNRDSGVGAETSFITSHFYRKSDMMKYIPVIMEHPARVPVYLKDRLAIYNTNDDGYGNILYAVYGIEKNAPPSLSSPPPLSLVPKYTRKRLTDRTKEFGNNNSIHVGNIISFGRYQHGAEGKKDPLKWRILSVEEDRVLLITDKLIDCVKYNKTREAVAWESCTLRKWMNEVFFLDAFNKEEALKIIQVTNKNPNNRSWNTNGGRDTCDRIFALSADEATKYFKNDEDRRAAITIYAEIQGCLASSSYKIDDRVTGWWWLRSPGDNNCNASSVYTDGNVYEYGTSVDNSWVSVRPALWLHL